MDELSYHIKETQRALKEADNGLFASDAEIAAFFNSTIKTQEMNIRRVYHAKRRIH
jgi:hypothetical protein